MGKLSILLQVKANQCASGMRRSVHQYFAVWESIYWAWLPELPELPELPDLQICQFEYWEERRTKLDIFDDNLVCCWVMVIIGEDGRYKLGNGCDLYNILIEDPDSDGSSIDSWCEKTLGPRWLIVPKHKFIKYPSLSINILETFAIGFTSQKSIIKYFHPQIFLIKLWAWVGYWGSSSTFFIIGLNHKYSSPFMIFISPIILTERS